MKCFSSSLLAACFLVCTGLALDCEWDQSIEEDQGLDLISQNAGLPHMELITDAKDPERCQAACCDKSDCDLALVGFPMDGEPQCMLVKCWIHGRDVCAFEPSTQFKVYRKKVETESRGKATEGGESLRIVPLLGSLEPRSNESNNIRCRLPMKVGSCRAAFPRFYYDLTNQSCRSFIYGGCNANGNNFDSQEECEATCSGVTGSVLPDESTAAPQLPVKAARMAPAIHTKMSAEDFAERCEAGPVVGPCRAALQHWYYNSKTGSCQPFIYGGCKGNKNNYNSVETCMAACTVTVLPSSKKAGVDEVSTEHRDHCMVRPDTGPCRAGFSMFYYDPNTDTCQSFIYGGCRGNNNRYSSMEECMKRCSADGWLNGHARSQNRGTAGLFLFITLAVISALLLAALIVMLKRRSLFHRPSSISDKQELLPDPDEQSSVESLTVPDSPKLDKA